MNTAAAIASKGVAAEFMPGLLIGSFIGITILLICAFIGYLTSSYIFMTIMLGLVALICWSEWSLFKSMIGL